MLELIWAMISLAHRSHRGTKLIFFRTRRSETCSYFIQYRPSWSDKQDSKWAAINKKKNRNFWKSSFSLLLSKKYCSSIFFSMLWKLQSVALNLHVINTGQESREIYALEWNETLDSRFSHQYFFYGKTFLSFYVLLRSWSVQVAYESFHKNGVIVGDRKSVV